MEDANSHPPFQVGVLSFTEHGYPLSSTLRSTSLCAVKPFPRHRAKQSLFHGPQRHTSLRGVCLLHPPETLTLNRSFLLPPPVPGRRTYSHTWHVLHSSRHLSDPRAGFAAHPSGGIRVARSSLDIINEADTVVSASSRAENET